MEKELKEELEYLETTPFYIGRDGLPNLPLIFLVLITGVVPGIIILLVQRHFRKAQIIKELKRTSNLI